MFGDDNLSCLAFLIRMCNSQILLQFFSDFQSFVSILTCCVGHDMASTVCRAYVHEVIIGKTLNST